MILLAVVIMLMRTTTPRPQEKMMTVGKIRMRDRGDENEQKPVHNKEEAMEGIKKVLETMNENMDDIDKIEIIGETDNTTKEAETVGELRMEGTKYDEFTAELNTSKSKIENMDDTEKETEETVNEGNTLYEYGKVAKQ